MSTPPNDLYLQGLEERGVLAEITAYCDAVEAGDAARYFADAAPVSKPLKGLDITP
jgi:hypothetical protein